MRDSINTIDMKSNYDPKIGFIEGNNMIDEDKISLIVEATGEPQATVSLIADSCVTIGKTISGGEWIVLSIKSGIDSYFNHFIEKNDGTLMIKVCKVKTDGFYTKMYDLKVKHGFRYGYKYTFKWLKN